MIRPKPVVLALVSGFGMSPGIEGNAIRNARLPVFHHLIETYPAMSLSVGPCANSDGRGSSFLTIGAGRRIPDTVERISLAANGAFGRAPAIRRAFDHAERNRGTVHAIGRIDDRGTVPVLLDSLFRDAKARGIAQPVLHAILDEDAREPERVAAAIRAVDGVIRPHGGRIASLSGARIAGDVNRDWTLVASAYDAIANGAPQADSLDSAIAAALENGTLGADLPPVAFGGTRVKSGDAIIFFDTDPRRIRELVTAFSLPSFNAFPRPYVQNISVTTLVETDPDLPVEAAFPPTYVEGTLGEAISHAGLRQLRISETEGFVDLTHHLNGGTEISPGEDRIIVPSPCVSRCERMPDMASSSIADLVVKEIAHGKYDVLIVRFVAPDRVARSGDEGATIAACETVDRAIGRMLEATLALDGVFLLTSDHGRAESLHDLDPIDVPACHPVPFIIAGRAYEGLKAPSGDVVGGDLALTAPAGTLADIAPTMLGILGIPAPKEMTGRALISFH